MTCSLDLDPVLRYGSMLSKKLKGRLSLFYDQSLPHELFVKGYTKTKHQSYKNDDHGT